MEEVGPDSAIRQKHRGRKSGGTCKPPGRYTRHRTLALLKRVYDGRTPRS